MKDRYFRKGARWAKVSGKRGRYIVAFGWRGNFKADRTQTWPRMSGAIIAARGWVED